MLNPLKRIFALRSLLIVCLAALASMACGNPSGAVSDPASPATSSGETTGDGSVAVPGSGGSGSASNAPGTIVQLGWQPNTDNVAGYIVYYGPTASTATKVASDVSISTNSFNPQAPAVSYNAERDLGAKAGSNVCFRLRAYNNTKTLSDWSQAACAAL